MNPAVESILRSHRWHAAAAYVVVTAFAWTLLWPIHVMPLSADHTVHLTRIWLWANELAAGNLRGWTPIWGFGTPVGELYPVLGDLVVIAVRSSSLGALPWPTAYALAFALMFASQGWVMVRASSVVGFGPWPGALAGLWLLADPGAYREGGWEYTVGYGVWPQAWATTLSWWAIAELVAAIRAGSDERPRRIAGAGLALGAGLLAHPMTLLTMAIAIPVVVITMRGRRFGTAVGSASIATAIGLGLAAWWLVPMFAHRGWMASYGWLWQPLDVMLKRALAGQWTQQMSPAIGWSIWAGFAIALFARSAAIRALVACGLCLWLAASHDFVWMFRLDRLSEGFSHLQYQRFLIAAKPGLILCATLGLAAIARVGTRRWRSGARGRIIAVVAVSAVAAVVSIAAAAQTELARTRNVGKVQRERIAGAPEFDRAYEDLLQWMAQQWQARTRFYRASVRDHRNIHWFMDAPVFTGMPLYKQGFTPGDNFVHKPESGSRTVLDRLQVRYEIVRGRDKPGQQPVASFGPVKVFERDGWERQPLVWGDAPAQVEVLDSDLERGTVRIAVQGTSGNARITFAVAGHPRWSLENNEGEALEWFEIPVTRAEPVATRADRRAGKLRGGKANGDDGTEPTLIAADLGDGQYVLRYRTWMASDVLALLGSLLTLAGTAGVIVGRTSTSRAVSRSLNTVHERLAGWVRPRVLTAVLFVAIAGLAIRCSAKSRAEERTAVGWDAVESLGGCEPHLFKTDMLIVPAWVTLDARRSCQVTFTGARPGATLTGWIAIDDDSAKLRPEGRWSMSIEIRPADSAASREWQVVRAQPVRHRPGRAMLAIDLGELGDEAIDVRMILEASGTPPAAAFDLELEGSP